MIALHASQPGSVSVFERRTMHYRHLILAAVCASGSYLWGAERTYTIANASAAQARSELALVVKAGLEIAVAQSGTDQRILTISGSEEELAAAEWLLRELDKPAPEAGEARRASAAFTMNGVSDGTITVFYLKGGRSTQQLQESATIIRSIADIRRVFTYNQTHAIAVRGTPGQIAAAEWIWRTLDDEPKAGAVEFSASLGSDNLLRAYHMPAEWSVQDLQEAAVVLRTTAELRRLFTYNRTRTIVTRGADSAIAATNWLASEIQRPASQALAVSEPFQMDDPRQEGVLRVFRIPARHDAAGLQGTAVDLRQQTQIRRIFTFNRPRMLVLRGTGVQIAEAGRILGAAQ